MKLQSALVGSILSLVAIGSVSSLSAQSIGVDKSSLAFTAQQGSSAVSTTLNVIGPAGGTTFTASAGACWLKVSPTSGSTPAALTVTADPTGLGVGTVQTTLTVAGTNSITIPVTLTITAGTGQTITVDKTSLAFVGQVGGPAVSQTVTVSSATAGQAFTAQSNATWLKVNPTSGNTPSALTVTADPTSLGAGTVSGTVTLTAANTVQIQVTFTVGSIGVSPQSLSLSYTQNGSFPGAQALSLTGQTVNYTATASTTTGGLWLQVAPTSGTTPTTLSVIANTVVLPTLAPGTYNGTITVTPSGQAAITIPVTLTVTGPAAVSVNPTALNFNYQTGQSPALPAPAAQNVTVTVTPAQQLNFSLTGTVNAEPGG